MTQIPASDPHKSMNKQIWINANHLEIVHFIFFIDMVVTGSSGKMACSSVENGNLENQTATMLTQQF